MLGKRFAGGILDSSLVMPERALVHVMVSKVLQATSARDEALRTHRPNNVTATGPGSFEQRLIVNKDTDNGSLCMRLWRSWTTLPSRHHES